MLITWFFLLCLVFFLCGAWVFARMFLIGARMDRYDSPRTEVPSGRRTGSPENAGVLRLINDFRRQVEAAPMTSRISKTRRLLDAGIAGTPVTPESLQVERLAVDGSDYADTAERSRIPDAVRESHDAKKPADVVAAGKPG